MTHYAVILATFEGDPAKALPYLERYDAIKDDISLIDVVAISREGDAEPTVEHRGKSRKAAGTGAVIGGLVGVLAGPGGVIFGAAVGGAVGGALKSLSHYGIPKAMLEQVEDGMAENSSSVLVIMEADRSDAIINELNRDGATVIHYLAERDTFDSLSTPSKSISEQ
ncbi:MAG: DUF1269 domain-containing protein [Chloroflexota bacterium]|jgi:uncharacterized membrane protein